jgi:hypothetical protein
MPAEFKGVPADKIKLNILRMEKDMEAELQTIRARYENKLEVMRKAYEIAQSQLKH